MATILLKSIAVEVATLLDESLELECRPEECRFPDIEMKVKLLVPGFLSEIIREEADRKGAIDIPASYYQKLLSMLTGELRK